MTDRDQRLAWFKAQILPHEAVLRHHLRRIGVAADDVDDFAAEAMTRAYATQDWAQISNGRAYLSTIGRNLVFDAARRRKVVAIETIPDLDVLHIADWQPSAESTVSAREELKVLQTALDQLPPRAREIFTLRRIEELSVKDIGAKLGLSVKTVEAHMTRALTALTEALQDSDRAAGSQTGTTWRTRRDRR
ncbi:MAG TPA: sigma-70 family RNA polymerase sigma factor [Caulobacteraceae bacterium]|nr:sigma-70 family RNA polymerase sigma factor [Caulobacteraceae bacterium]